MVDRQALRGIWLSLLKHFDARDRGVLRVAVISVVTVQG
jgi:hypothetical protein